MFDDKTLDNYLKTVCEAKKAFPDFIVGFDMVQEEDVQRQLIELQPTLSKLREYEKPYGVHVPFVFHGGESINSITNTNLYDAVLMDSKRIGHGVNLMMHSGLMNTIKEQKICIECCPVSNQVLRYIDDIRVHPIKIYLNYGIPTVIAPDDPSYFNSFSNDDDFYYAAIGSELDLKDLKLCVKNSIMYSLASPEEK